MRQDQRKPLRILIKSIVLFAVFNYSFVLVPNSAIWQLSLYNTVLPGRPRFTQEADLDLLFDTHEIASSMQRPNEYKVLVLGDSSTWGTLLNPEETFSGVINASNFETCQNRPVHVYNLGIAQLSLFKDLIILQRAMDFHPDLVIWMVTLNSTIREIKQHPIVNDNPEIAQELIDKYKLGIKINAVNTVSIEQKTFLARKNDFARFIQFQLDGLRWLSTGEDSHKEYRPIGMDVSADHKFGGLPPPTLDPHLIEFEVLNAGISVAQGTPLIIVNEPIQIATGNNTEIRYNKNYPRWAYDQYRDLMKIQAEQNHWNYKDYWDLVPPTEFSDSAVHRTVQGEEIVTKKIEELIFESPCPQTK
jgi:hypothetical protein